MDYPMKLNRSLYHTLNFSTILGVTMQNFSYINMIDIGWEEDPLPPEIDAILDTS